MISPVSPSAPTMFGKGARPTTEASMTGRWMKWDHIRGRILPVYSFSKPRVQLCTPKHQFVSLPHHLQLFWERLDSYGNCSMWENLSYIGEGEWIWDGLCGGFLCIAHDGSYMVEESPNLCSEGVIIFCSSTRQWLKSSVVELSDAASNYQGELLGAVNALLILRAASNGIAQPLPEWPERGLSSSSEAWGQRRWQLKPKSWCPYQFWAPQGTGRGGQQNPQGQNRTQWWGRNETHRWWEDISQQHVAYPPRDYWEPEEKQG